MDGIWMAVSPEATDTRVIVTRGGRETILKARLSNRPASRLAPTALLEAVSLWEGSRVRAAFVVDEPPSAFEQTSSADFVVDPEHTALYDVTWLPRLRFAPAGGRSIGLRGLGSFGDLRQRLSVEVAR